VYLEKGACVKERERERERNWYSFCIQLYFYIIIYIPSTLDAGYYYIDFCLLPETRTFDGATNLREEARARTTTTQFSGAPLFVYNNHQRKRVKS
jgi:hypothetical protein